LYLTFSWRSSVPANSRIFFVALSNESATKYTGYIPEARGVDDPRVRHAHVHDTKEFLQGGLFVHLNKSG
jgi:hypothetical protein